MGLRKKALKAVGYAAAPKLSMMIDHPKKMAFAKTAGWMGSQVAERMVPSRFRPQPRRSALGMAARGLGAAAMAAPLGWWMGRRMTARQQAGRAPA